MKSFEEISKMNLAELDRPAGAGEEELETETTGAAGNHSVSDAEKAGTTICGVDALEHAGIRAGFIDAIDAIMNK